MPKPCFTVLSGIPPSDSGTGQLVRWLIDRGVTVLYFKASRPSRRSPSRPVRVLVKLVHLAVSTVRLLEFRIGIWRLARTATAPVVVLHPQTLGFSRTLAFMARCREPTWLYLLDSSYFCVRSYNTLRGETMPCERCLGGDITPARTHGCVPFPDAGKAAYRFVVQLRDLVANGTTGLLAQCTTQAEMASRHFGRTVEKVGMWTADLERMMKDTTGSLTAEQTGTVDVVFHGFDLDAKGSRWSIELARHLTGLTFLFPFVAPDDVGDLPGNARFQPMRWDEGLLAQVRSARLVLVPSLWSAPVESALIKSLWYARRTAVVASTSAFAATCPADIVEHLPAEIDGAAQRVKEMLATSGEPRREAVRTWVRGWAEHNREFAERIATVVARPKNHW